MEVVHHEASFPVCIVDADPAVRDSLASVIDLHGLPVRCYATGTQFLTETRRVLQVRSVICDAQLPDLSGLDVYRQLVSLGVTAPFALMVSRRSPILARMAEELGVEAVLAKPIVQPEMVLRFIDEPVH